MEYFRGWSKWEVNQGQAAADVALKMSVYWESHYEQSTLFQRFIEFGADLTADAHDQMTPLMSVCSTSCSHGQDKDVFEKNLVKCAKILLQKGKVDVNARQSQRLTALM